VIVLTPNLLSLMLTHRLGVSLKLSDRVEATWDVFGQRPQPLTDSGLIDSREFAEKIRDSLTCQRDNDRPIFDLALPEQAVLPAAHD